MSEMRRSSSGSMVDVKAHLDSITPNKGPAGGGQQVILKGTGLGTIVRVLFGTEEATDVQVTNTTKLSCTTPSNSHGPCKVHGIADDDSKTNELTYTYE